MKQYLKLELLIELPNDFEFIKPSTTQVDNNKNYHVDKKMTMSVDEIAEELYNGPSK
ncbi:hypothetical protein [Lysinibacillus sphaericus]|uniref:hypothetical protein n=1 Tax=Lysinibacillus sphaericus TaxID=1421 RepID=UPI0003A79B4D|nr:hypothetical protein [Lysinibacillus sphaericus]